MDYKLEDIIDIPLIQSLQEKLDSVYSFPSAIIDNKGKILTAVAWQDICTKFHRKNPECEKECIKSDQYILEHLSEANPAVSYQCPHGMIDNATPIIIEGKHLGNFFTGQFFLEKPDLEFFRKQAQKYGFDENEYLRAIEKVPVWSKEKLAQYLDFIKGFIEIIASIGLKSLIEIETRKKIKESEERNSAIIHSTNDWIWEIDELGRYSYCSSRIDSILGYTVEEIIGKTPFDLMPEKERERVNAIFQDLCETKSPIVDLENYNLHKDGHLVCMLTNGAPIINETGKLIGYRGADKDITERKKAEVQLHRMQDLLDRTSSLSHVGGWEIDIKTQKLTWTKEVFTIHEVDDDFVPTVENAINFYAPQSRPIIQDAVGRAIEYGEPFDVELQIITAKSNLRWVHAIGNAAIQDGKVVSIQGVFQDFTQRKKTEEALLESEEIFRNFMDHSPIYLFFKDENIRAIKLSKNYETMLGKPMAELLGKNMYDLFPSELARSIVADDKKILEEGKNITVEEEFNGQQYLTTKFPITLDGKPRYLAGFTMDITDRKLAEEKLIRSEKELLKVQQISHIGSWFLDLSTNKVKWTEELYKMYGFDPTLPPPDYTEHQKLFSPESWDLLSSSLAKTTDTGIPYELELKTLRTDGSNGWMWVRGETVQDSTGKTVGLWGAAQDISQRKQFEEELSAAKEKAEESDRLKSAFLANMSHEIRTPMNGILGFAELLKEPGLTGEQQDDYIKIIEKSGARMLNIINDIVDISKIESGQMKVTVSETNVNDQIDFLCKFFKKEAEKKGLQLISKSALLPKDSIVLTDREKLYAILTNLIKNALKYTDIGTIEFGCQVVETQFIPTLQFFVKDTGIGIPQDKQKAIFERFIQADIKDIQARQGAGLGLSISKAFVEMLGGSIWVESREGVGSTFYFTLPYQTNSSKQIADKRIDSNPIPVIENIPFVPRLKILIAEDDEISEMFLSILIKDFSGKVFKAINGLEAVEICRKNPDLDLILMDINMPEMGGYEATRQIRQFNEKVVIIAQTAYGLLGDREKSIQAGCNDYISKPIKSVELHALITKYFN